MPRPKRIALEGFIYHVVNRGNNRQPVFKDKDDFLVFLRVLKKFKDKYAFKLYAFCLMNNHYHLILEPTQPRTLSKIIQSVTLSYLRLHHKKYAASGHLWQGRFKSPVIDKDEYLLECLRYVELNPVRAKMVKHPKDYAFSSYAFHGLGKDPRGLLDDDAMYLSLGKSGQERQEAYRKFLSGEQDEAVVRQIRNSIQAGLALASDHFMAGLRQRVHMARPRPRGRPRKKENTESGA